MPGHDLIVIGASAGGIEALRELCRQLPVNLPASVCVVVHIPGSASSALPSILSRSGVLPAVQAVHGDKLRPGRIYVAPPNFHLLVQDNHLALSSSSPENTHRPAIDPLFRSAARVFGPRTVAVVLSGADDDGTEGALMIKRRGGKVLVQDPAESIYRRMPASVIDHVEVDAVLPVARLASELCRLTTVVARWEERAMNAEPARTGGEDNLDEATAQVETTIEGWLDGEQIDRSTGFVCPTCGGGIWESQIGSLLRFRCHTGHRFSPSGFSQAQATLLEQTLWQAFALLEQRSAFLRKMAGKANQEQRGWMAERYATRASELEPGLNLLRELLEHGEGLVAEPDETEPGT
jgi:two-component system chemotaxis response regulator CheB